MTGVRMVKCPICEVQFDRNSTTDCIKIRNRWIHNECVPARIEKEIMRYKTPERQKQAEEEFLLEVQEAIEDAEKRKEELEEAVALLEETEKKREQQTTLRSNAREIAGEQEDRTNLIGYIHKLFLGKVHPRVYRQIEHFRWDKGITYKEMHGALFYFYEIRRNSIEGANGGIGIVPYVIEDANYYYEQEAKRRKKLENSILKAKPQAQEKPPKTKVIIKQETEKESAVTTLDLSDI